MTNEPTEAEMSIEMALSMLDASLDGSYVEHKEALAVIRKALAEAKALKQRVEGAKKLTLWWIKTNKGEILKRATDDPNQWNGSTISEHDRFQEVYAVPVVEPSKPFDPAQDEKEHLERVKKEVEK